jgi:hypothetical protein
VGCLSHARTPRPADHRRQGPLRPPGRRADQRGRITRRDRCGHCGRCVAVRVRKRLRRRRPAGPGPRVRPGRRTRGRFPDRFPQRDGRIHRLRAGRLRPRTTARTGHLQRALPRPGRRSEDTRRRARPVRDPDQRAAARPDRHRPGPRAGRPHRRPDEVCARLSQNIPLRRYGEPAEFGQAAAFVLAPAASYITGAMIPVDGGAIRSI